MMQGYKFVTSHDALVAELAEILAKPHWVLPELQRGPVEAAKQVTRLLAIGLSARPDHVPLRVNGNPVLDETLIANFFAP